MKKCSIFCYFEAIDSDGKAVFSGNHTCNVSWDGYISASEYVTNTSEFLLADCQRDNPSVERVVIKNVTIFPFE